MRKCPNCGVNIRRFLKEQAARKEEQKRQRRQNFENLHGGKLAVSRRRHKMIKLPVALLGVVITLFLIAVIMASVSWLNGDGFYRDLQEFYSEIKQNIILTIILFSLWLLVWFLKYPTVSRKEKRLWDVYKKVHPLPE